MHDKPPAIVRLILGEIAELSTGLRRLGLPPEAVDRLVDAYVARRLGTHLPGGGFRRPPRVSPGLILEMQR